MNKTLEPARKRDVFCPEVELTDFTYAIAHQDMPSGFYHFPQ